MTGDIERRYELARSISLEAGRLALELFQSPTLTVERKDDGTPVTLADRRAEEMLRQRISDAFPYDAILGEEFGRCEGQSGYEWILDPIDGTKSFVCGVPLFGTLVGVTRGPLGVIGVIYLPALDEGVHAAENHGAWWFGSGSSRPARVSSRRRLAQSTFVTSEAAAFGQRGATSVYQQLEQRAMVTRTWGDCYGYLLVATGRVELMIDPKMSIWDAAAVQPIVKQAGGVFTDWAGNERIDAGEGIGATPQLLDEVIEITRPFASASS